MLLLRPIAMMQGNGCCFEVVSQTTCIGAAAGTKQQLQVAVEKARRLGKSPATKVATQQAGGQPSNMGFVGGSGSSYPAGSPMSNSG